jgi:hypothetical protein
MKNKITFRKCPHFWKSLLNTLLFRVGEYNRMDVYEFYNYIIEREIDGVSMIEYPHHFTNYYMYDLVVGKWKYTFLWRETKNNNKKI